jgi:hypothetical protein
MQQRFAMLPRAKIAFRTVVPFQLRITVVRRAVHQTSESNPCVDEATLFFESCKDFAPTH